MEVTLVHPDNKEQKAVATHPQQVAALQSQGFVEVEVKSNKKVRENKETK